MKRLLLFVLFASFVLAQAVEPKQVGSSQLKIGLEWRLQAQDDGKTVFKTFAFPNTTYQSVSFTTSDSFVMETDSLGNRILRFDFDRKTGVEKTIRVSAVANVNFVNSDEVAVGAKDYLAASTLVLLSPQVKTQASLITQNASTPLEKLVFLTEWVHSNVAYDEAYWGVDVSSDEVLHDKRGVCVEYSHLLMALLRSEGIPARLAAGFVFSGSRWDAHAWVEAAIGGKWVAADPTYDEAIVLDGTHVAFAFGRDHLDIKEEVTQGVQLVKPGPVVELAKSEKPDFFSISLNAPDETGPASAETIVATVKNKFSKALAAPVILIAPDKPEELAVRVAKPREKLVLLSPGEEKRVSWVAVFPSEMQEAFYYNFTLETKTMGASDSKTVRGSLGNRAATVERVEIAALDYSISGEGLSLAVTVENKGGSETKAILYASISGKEQDATLILSPFEQKKATFLFKNGQNAESGEIRVITASQVLRQPFTIEQPAQEQKHDWLSPEAIATLGVLVIVTVSFALLKARKSYQEV